MRQQPPVDEPLERPSAVAEIRSGPNQCLADAVLRFAQYAFILWDAAFLAAADIPRL